MGWRFRKSVTLMPGVRMNFGLHGPSISVGGKGFRTTYGSNGRVTRSIGIPGTGISYVTTSNSRPRQAPSGRTSSERPVQSARSTSLPSMQQEPVQPAQHLSVPDYQAVYDTAYNQIRAIYQVSDEEVNWRQILISGPVLESDSEQTAYYKSLAQNVLNGDIDTYLKLVSDLNPLDDLMEYGSEFECGTDDPRMIGVQFTVNSQRVLSAVRNLPQEQYNSLFQDYVCGCAIRIARDMFALLPVRHIVVDAIDKGNEILSVDFIRTPFLALDFDELDPSEAVERFENSMFFNTQ